MAKSVEKEAKTVEEAIDLCLAELGIELEDADVEILDEGNKGVLGIGAKSSKVRVSEHISDVKFVKTFLETIIAPFNIENLDIRVSEDDDGINAEVFGDNVGGLIGKFGDTIYAVSYLVNRALNKDRENYKRVNFDVEGYKEQREKSLEEIAKKAAARVIRMKRPVSLNPMSAYERRIIHATLQSNPNVISESQGSEPHRCVVIKLKPYTKVF